MVPGQAPLYMTGDQLLFFLRMWRFIYANHAQQKDGVRSIPNPRLLSIDKIVDALRDLELEDVVMDAHVPITYKLIDRLFHPFIEVNQSELHAVTVDVSPFLDFVIQESMISNGTVARVREFMEAVADDLITPELVWQESSTKPMSA